MTKKLYLCTQKQRRKFDKKPTKRGIYVLNGKKIVIK
jgi:hypothetical protein